MVRITNSDLRVENASVKENNLLLTSRANCLQMLPGAAFHKGHEQIQYLSGLQPLEIFTF